MFYALHVSQGMLWLREALTPRCPRSQRPAPSKWPLRCYTESLWSLASRVTFSLSTPSCSAMTSATFKSLETRAISTPCPLFHLWPLPGGQDLSCSVLHLPEDVHGAWHVRREGNEGYGPQEDEGQEDSEALRHCRETLGTESCETFGALERDLGLRALQAPSEAQLSALDPNTRSSPKESTSLALCQAACASGQSGRTPPDAPRSRLPSLKRYLFGHFTPSFPGPSRLERPAASLQGRPCP